MKDKFVWLLTVSKHSSYIAYNQALNNTELYLLSTECIYVFCIDLRTNINICSNNINLIGYYNLEGQQLLHGTEWALK